MTNREFLKLMLKYLRKRLSALEWCAIFKINIIEPTGWEQRTVDFDAVINICTFCELLAASTVDYTERVMDPVRDADASN